MSVRMIPARRKQAVSPGSVPETARLKIAAYCRVSTDLEEQESSYEAQMAHYSEIIGKNPDWVLADIYADEGISGTSTEKREEFNRMIGDCENGKIDMIVTKSISRFARNTLDCLQYIRRLKALNIPILFETENINTMGTSGELLITIMASLAQQESQSISQNVRMGIQYNFQRGKPMLNHSRFLGNTKQKGGSLVIVPEEADVVRGIFRDFLEGLSFGEIISGLEERGIRTPAGREKWYHSTIQSMLKNEKYMGDLLLQKSYTKDFLTKERADNQGTFPQYYVKNAHAPIVPREVFMRVQGALLRRENDLALAGKRSRPSVPHALHGKLICGICGQPFCRYTPPSGVTYWRCKSRITKGQYCESATIADKDIRRAVINAFNRLPYCKEDLIRMQERILWGPLDRISAELSEREIRKEDLEQELEEAARESRRASLAGGARAGTADTGSMRAGTAGTGSMHAGMAGTGWDKTVFDPDAGSCAALQARLDTLLARRDDLLAQKADLSIHEVQIQSALKLIEAITGRKQSESAICLIPDITPDTAAQLPARRQAAAGGFAGGRNSGGGFAGSGSAAAGSFSGATAAGAKSVRAGSDDPASCRDLADFYARTDRIDQQGIICVFDHAMVKRFINTVTVYPDHIFVAFKAGVGIRVVL